jgi:PIN domain nuclease of toxin-antitoxin system
LLDIAPWINAVLIPESLPSRIMELFASDEPKGLCSVSLLEAAILYRLKRFELNSTLAQFFEISLAENLRLMELNPVIAEKTNHLSEKFHGDPFDRTIVATASVQNLILITTDVAIRDSMQCQVEYYPFKPFRTKT